MHYPAISPSRLDLDLHEGIDMNGMACGKMEASSGHKDALKAARVPRGCHVLALTEQLSYTVQSHHFTSR